MTLKDLVRKLQNLEFVDKQLMNQIGDTAVKRVKERTRRGFGVDKDGASAKKLKGLSAPYKKARRKLRKTGELSSETAPAKSNLTRTGKMIDSVNYRATNNSATIEVSGSENQRKAKDQDSAGRKFMNLSKGELKDINDIIETSINNDIKKEGL